MTKLNLLIVLIALTQLSEHAAWNFTIKEVNLNQKAFGRTRDSFTYRTSTFLRGRKTNPTGKPGKARLHRVATPETNVYFEAYIAYLQTRSQ